MSMHESFEREDSIGPGSDRAFGLVFAVFFAIVAVWPLLFGDGGVRMWALIIAAGFVAVALLRASLLRPLNRLWTRFGLLLHRVVNPLVMGLMFYVVITPAALIMRAFGKDPMRRGFDRSATSYWIERNPPGPPPDTMPNQF